VLYLMSIPASWIQCRDELSSLALTTVPCLPPIHSCSGVSRRAHVTVWWRINVEEQRTLPALQTDCASSGYCGNHRTFTAFTGNCPPSMADTKIYLVCEAAAMRHIRRSTGRIKGPLKSL
jgi:hypothetical protein